MTTMDQAVRELDFWEHVRDYENEINSIFSVKNDLTRRFSDITDPETKTIADFGCGPGNALKYFSRFKAVYAIDFSPNMLNQARSNNQQQTNIRYFENDIKTVCLPEKADCSVSVNSIFTNTYGEFDEFFGNILCNTREKGTILLLLPSFESYTFHLQMVSARRFAEETDLETTRQELDLIFQGYKYSPLGFILSDLNRVQKKWLKEEIEFRLSGYGLEQISVEKMVYHKPHPLIPDHRRWYWMVRILC